MTLKNKVAIIGAAETTELGVIPDKSMTQLHADAAYNAIQDAGIDKSEIDGVLCARPSPTEVAHYLGITPRYVDGTSVGGCSFMLHVRHAAAAIATGMCDVVLVTHGESGKSRVGVGGWGGGGMDASLAAQFEMPYGPTGPPTMFPMGVLRYMKDTGTTHEQL